MYTMKCQACNDKMNISQYITTCPKCGNQLGFEYDYHAVRIENGRKDMWRYQSLLPLLNGSNIISLQEGATPLIRSGLSVPWQLFIKNETRNPTGSVKDRAISLAVSKAKELGLRNLLAASTGSVGLSLAAYGAKAGCQVTIIVPRNTSEERLVPMALFGAKILEIDGIYEEGMHWMEEAKSISGWYVASTYRKANPYQSEAPKTISYEIVDDLGEPPDILVAPVGGGGTLAGIWQGFLDLQKMGRIHRLPRLFGIQAEQFSILKRAMQKNIASYEDLYRLSKSEHSGNRTVAINLAHVLPPDGMDVLQAIRESNGAVLAVSDDETIKARKQLAEVDGIFVEPSSAVVVACLHQLSQKVRLAADTKVVLVLTGSGFRESGAAAMLHLLEKKKVSPQLKFREIITA